MKFSEVGELVFRGRGLGLGYRLGSVPGVRLDSRACHLSPRRPASLRFHEFARIYDLLPTRAGVVGLASCCAGGFSATSPHRCVGLGGASTLSGADRRCRYQAEATGVNSFVGGSSFYAHLLGCIALFSVSIGRNTAIFRQLSACSIDSRD